MWEKEIWNYNIKIHYIWTFISSIMFLEPIVSLYYIHNWLNLNSIVLLTALYSFFIFLFELPTSSIGDTLWRTFTMRASVICTLIGIVLYLICPNIYGFVIALLFKWLGTALWSGTGHSKLQEDLEAAQKNQNFWKIIWRLIWLQQIWQIITPVGIYFVLKYFSLDWFSILAWLDIFIFFIAVIFVFKFKELDSYKKEIWKSFKENISIQIKTIKKALIFFWNSKILKLFLLVMITWNSLNYIQTILLPNFVKSWFQNYLSSYLVWFIIIFGIAGNFLAGKISKYINRELLLSLSILGNSILYIFAFYFYENWFIFAAIGIAVSFIIGIYIPARNHIFMELSNIQQKASLRSIFLLITKFFEFIILYFFSIFYIKNNLLILWIYLFLWFIVSVIFYYKAFSNQNL